MLQDQEQNEGRISDAAERGRQQVNYEPGSLAVYVAGNPENFGDVVGALEAHGFGIERDFDALTEKFLMDPEARLVIVYENPVSALAGQMDLGSELDQAIAAWLGETEKLLDLFRRDRRRITLVDGHAAMGGLALFRRLLGARLRIAMEESAEAASEPAGDPAGLTFLIAAQALRQSEAAAPLAIELEASSLPLGAAYRVDVDAVVEAWKTASTAAELPLELETVREENELLLLQLHQVQEELEAHFLENRKLGSQIDEARAAADKARLSRDSLEDEFHAARVAWRNERKSLTDKLKWTADDLGAVRRSLSWKLTAPLRRLLGLFTGGTKL